TIHCSTAIAADSDVFGILLHYRRNATLSADRYIFLGKPVIASKVAKAWGSQCRGEEKRSSNRSSDGTKIWVFEK
ncbi:MAG: hypothetical protein KBF83_04245, partial [Pyrinomonadaceae bacterium]|nr:hypothetical protein [Pyrinomonadaceae bacterium]